MPLNVETSTEPGGPTGFNPVLILDALGNPLIVYNDRRERQGAKLGDLRFVHCNDPACDGDDDTSIIVESVFWHLAAPASLVLDSAGNPVISYINWRTSSVELLHCNDPDCAGKDDLAVVVHRFTDVGRYTSTVLDASGNPVIAYNWDYRQDFSRLRVAHCADPTCSTSTVESPGFPANLADETGFAPSLALDASGNPVVAYHSVAPNRELTLVHCNDPDCADDVVAPMATIALANGQAAVTSSNAVSFSVVFHEPVAGFDATDVIVSGSAGAAMATVSGSGPAYTVTIGSIPSDGTVTINIPAGAVTDVSGNESMESIVVANTVTVEGLVAPTTKSPTPTGQLPATGGDGIQLLLATLVAAGGWALMRLARRRIPR